MKGMKGLELPVNMIVIVLIAVLVLVVVGAFFAGQIGTGTGSINLEQAFGEGCQRLRTVQNCAPDEFTVLSYTPPGQTPGTGANFFGDICRMKGYTPDSVCAVQCGCPP